MSLFDIKIIKITKSLIKQIVNELKGVTVNIAILGVPGSGKSTQSEYVAKKMNIPIMSFDNVCPINNNNDDELIMDEIFINVIKDKISDGENRGFVLDGFPQSIEQAQVLEAIGIEIDLMIELLVPDERVCKRINGRYFCNQCGKVYHIDYVPTKKVGICDNCGEKTYKKCEDVSARISDYHKKIGAIRDFYAARGKYRTVEGIEEIADTKRLTFEDIGTGDLSSIYNEKNNLSHYKFGEGFVESSGVILPKRKHIVSRLEVAESIEIVNCSLLSKIKGNEESLFNLSPHEFEEFVGEVFEKNGFNVKLTKKTHDGGKDIIVCENRLIGNFLTYVECKRFNKNRPVSISLVRELYGTVMADRATAGIIVTTSHFSCEAELFVKDIRNQISLIDYNKLVEIISKTGV